MIRTKTETDAGSSFLLLYVTYDDMKHLVILTGIWMRSVLIAYSTLEPNHYKCSIMLYNVITSMAVIVF